MKKFLVKNYSYVDEKGKVHPSGTELTLSETSKYVKQQMYKLSPVVEGDKMSKTTIADLMITKALADSVNAPAELPKGSIRDRVAAMVKETQGK